MQYDYVHKELVPVQETMDSNQFVAHVEQCSHSIRAI